MWAMLVDQLWGAETSGSVSPLLPQPITPFL